MPFSNWLIRNFKSKKIWRESFETNQFRWTLIIRGENIGKLDPTNYGYVQFV